MEEGRPVTYGLSTSVKTLLTLLVGTAFWKLFIKKRFAHRNLPPGPTTLVILGNLPFARFRGGRDVHVTFSQLSKKYGDIFSFWAGNKLIVVLETYDKIREALVDNAVVMAGRPTERSPGINPNNKGIIQPTYSAEWKHDRNLSLSILKDFGFGKSLMEDHILEEVDATITYLDTMTDVAFDPGRIMQISVSNVICSIALGRHFQRDDKEFMDMVEIMDQYLEAYLDTVAARFVPLLRLLPSKRAAINRRVRFHEQMLDFLRSFIEEHKKCHVTGDTSDFIHAYLDRTGGEADDESLLFLIRDLFLAGTETTSTALRWAFVYMANYPDVQKKVQEELDRVLQKGRLPSLRDKAELPYTEAVILELLRLAAVAPQIIPHETLDDVTLSGYLIPKGTLILGNLWGVQRDPTLWPEPDKMKPERFLTEGGNVLHRPELIPFSLGRRACLGEIMARQEIFLFFAAILHNYSIERPDGVDKIDESGRTLFTRVPGDYEIIIRRRP